MEKRIQDYSFKYDKNWYFNTDNIPSSKLVFDTYDFLESFNVVMHQDLGLQPTDFINLFYYQYFELLKFKDKPIDFIAHLKTIPVSENSYFLLIGFILKWYGGLGNFDSKIDTILRLLSRELKENANDSNREFLDYFDNESEKYTRHQKLINVVNKINDSKQHNLITDSMPSKSVIDEKANDIVIKWEKESVLLAFLINELKTYGFIDDTNIWSACEKVFRDRKGNQIKATTYTSMVKNYESNKTTDGISKGIPTKSEEIVKLINILKKISKEL